MTNDFTKVTELAGDVGSREQVQRAYRRYYWAGDFVSGASVLEIGCGVGQGLGYLARRASAVIGGDVCEPLLRNASAHYGNRVELHRFDAIALPYASNAFDVVLIFEAIYYVADVERLVAEVARVLRPGGTFLIVTANKDLFDFTPSPYSVQYLGVVELADVLRRRGFETEFFGDTPVAAVSLRQRILRPFKYLASRSGLMPKGKWAKGLLKRLVFGSMHPLPREIEPGMDAGAALTPLRSLAPNRDFKVLHCVARLSGQSTHRDDDVVASR